jgi:hypothetical protein
MRSQGDARLRRGTGLALACLAILLAAPASRHRSQANYDANLLVNPSLETFGAPYGTYPPDGRPLQVGTGWQRFWIAGSNLTEPYWMDARVFGWGRAEVIDGQSSQSLFSAQPFDAGIYQQVGGLTPGLGYAFNAPMTSVYRSTGQPPVDDKIFKRVGLDPTGGTNPDAPTVIWSEADGTDRTWRVRLRAAAFAQSSTVTVFARVTSPEPVEPPPFLNQSWIDSAILAQTPYVKATSPAQVDAPAFTVSWTGAQPAPGGSIESYDVQVLDEAVGQWQDWLVETTATSAAFTGAMGHGYRFRARAMQVYDSGPRLQSPYRPEGDTLTWVGAARITGQVRDLWDNPIAGATVAVVGTAYQTTTQPGGTFQLYLPPLSGQAVEAGHGSFGPLPPVVGVDLPAGAVLALDYVLPPWSDAVVNGGFETGLSGWQVAPGSGLTPGAHTGTGALRVAPPSLSREPFSPPSGLTVVATTTFPLAGLLEPALGLWYAPEQVDPDGRLELWVTLLDGAGPGALPIAATHTFAPDLDVVGWHHAGWPLGEPGEVLTGTVRLQVALREASVGLDEIALGGVDRPLRLYLPAVGR